jgi:uncharacterized protein (DUF488 family)
VVRKHETQPLVVLTTGHSTRSIVEFIALLKEHDVKRLVDVRTIPKSAHNPQFAREALSAALYSARIHYRHMPGLGGFRHPKRDSVNAGWRNSSFRGYADYMLTPEFEKNLEALIGLAREERTVIMCAEALPWRCHRSLISDALTVRGIEAREIISGGVAKLHELTSFAHVEGTEIIYPPESGQMSLLS